MLRFYLRAASTIATAILLTLLVLRLWVDSAPDELNLQLLRGHAAIHAETIAQIPPAERRAAVTALSARLGYGVAMEQNRGATQIHANWRSGQLFVIAPVSNTPGQLAFGPLPYRNPSTIPVIVAVTLSISLILTWIALRPAVARIRMLESAAASMCKGDFSVRVSGEYDDILFGIGLSLNQLADRIGQLLSDERDLLRTVAHEVRAPISRMRFRVERIHDKVSAELGRDARGLVSDLQQVDNLFEELLTYVAFDEFDTERPVLQTALIDVDAAVRRLVDEVTATQSAVAVTVQGDNASIVGNPKLFDRAVTNLLLNALAYGGDKVNIFIRNFAEECVIDVQDAGPGIPELDRPKVIKPFVRLATKRTRGTGLGLAIVTRIMNLHNGRLHIVDAPTGGASIQLVWKNTNYKPRAPSLLQKWVRASLG